MGATVGWGGGGGAAAARAAARRWGGGRSGEGEGECSSWALLCASSVRWWCGVEEGEVVRGVTTLGQRCGGR